MDKKIEELIRSFAKKVVVSEKVASMPGQTDYARDTGRQLADDPDAETALGSAPPGTAGGAAANAESEFQWWAERDENDPEVQARLQQYADHVGRGRNLFPRLPWSAGFISWLFRDDPSFKKSASHATYMRDAKRNRDAGATTGYVAHQPDELSGDPDPGDVVCRDRGTGDGFWSIGRYNHCDVYVGGGQMIGGNLGDTSKKVSYDSSKAKMIIKKLAEKKELSESELRSLIREGILFYESRKLEKPTTETEITEQHLRAAIRKSLILREKVAKIGQTDYARDTGRNLSDDEDVGTPSVGSFSGSTGGGGTAGDPEKSNNFIIYNWEVGDSPRIVYVYPGVGYGTQGFVNRRIQNKVGSSPNTILVIAPDNATPWSSLKAAGDSALGDKTPSSKRLVGWSGGSRGLADAIESDSFDGVWYADPSPKPLIGKNHPSNVKMYYKVSNWKGTLARLGLAQRDKLAPELGSRAIEVDSNHNEILDQSVREALAESVIVTEKVASMAGAVASQIATAVIGDEDWEPPTGAAVASTSGSTEVAAMAAAARPVFQAFLDDAASRGYAIKINSTRRTPSHQWNLKYNDSSALTPARPCRSDHQYGYAMDLNFKPPGRDSWVMSSEGDVEWASIVQIAADHGLEWQGSDDRVHFYMPGGVSSARKDQCTDELEAVCGGDIASCGSQKIKDLEQDTENNNALLQSLNMTDAEVQALAEIKMLQEQIRIERAIKKIINEKNRNENETK